MKHIDDIKLYEMSINDEITDYYNIPVIIFLKSASSNRQWVMSVEKNEYPINSFRYLTEALDCLNRNPGLKLKNIK